MRDLCGDGTVLYLDGDGDYTNLHVIQLDGTKHIHTHTQMNALKLVKSERAKKKAKKTLENKEIRKFYLLYTNYVLVTILSALKSDPINNLSTFYKHNCE